MTTFRTPYPTQTYTQPQRPPQQPTGVIQQPGKGGMGVWTQPIEQPRQPYPTQSYTPPAQVPYNGGPMQPGGLGQVGALMGILRMLNRR